jgi:hypothetical protein
MGMTTEFQVRIAGGMAEIGRGLGSLRHPLGGGG